MKRLWLLLLFSTVALGQNTVSVTASHIYQQYPSQPLPSGTILFQAVGTNGQAISYQVGGAGPNITAPTVCPITTGAITGTCTLPDVQKAIPQNFCFQASVKSSSNVVVLGGPDSGYNCVQPTQTAYWCYQGVCNFDNFAPGNYPTQVLLITLPPPGPSTLGGIDSTFCPLGQVVNGYQITGQPNCVAGGGSSSGVWGTITGSLSNQTDLYTYLLALAPLNSPSLSGQPTVPTPLSTDNSLTIVNSAWVQGMGYAPLASPAFTGTPTAPTQATNDSSTKLATTAWVNAQGYGSATGNVSGPSSSILNDIVLFGGINGKSIIDSNIQFPIAPANIGTLVAGSNGLVTSATTDTTNASNITSGTLPAAQLPNPSTSSLGGVKASVVANHQWVAFIDNSGTPNTSQPSCFDLSNDAPSCSTDTTNASNITSGTLAHARLPALVSGDIPNNAANTTGTAANLSGTPTLPNGTTLPGYVPIITTVNSHPLSSNVTVLASDLPSGTFVTGMSGVTQTAGDTSTKLATDQFVATAIAGGTQVYPASGIGNSTGSTWGASYNSSNLIPANFISTLNQNTTGTAANVTGTVAIANGGTATASTLSGLVRGGNPFTASELSGDVSTSGSNVTTLASVNSNIGTYTYATVVANAKGQITAISNGAAPALASTTVNGFALSSNVTVTPASLPAGTFATGMAAVTQATSDSSTAIATDAFVKAQGYYAPNGLTKGWVATPSSATAISSSDATIFVSQYCGGITTCPDYSSESAAIIAAIASATANTVHIVDDMCGTEYWTSQPFGGANARGLFEFLNNCRHIVVVDGTSTIQLNTGMYIVGSGADGTTVSTQTSNTVIEACNEYVQDCPNGGFVVQNSNACTMSVSGAVGTITCTGAPFTTTATSVNHVGPGRLLCYDSSDALNSTIWGCWVVQSVVSATAPQQFTVGVVSGATTSCASGCGYLYLDTPLMTVGIDTSGQGVYHTGFRDLSLDCQYAFGCSDMVQAQGEEGTDIGHIQMWNAVTYYARLDQSSAYGGPASGDTNSGPYGPWAGNERPVSCLKAAGCTCNNPAGGGHCNGGVAGAGTTPTGDLIGCGTTLRNSVTDTFALDPCYNPNFAAIPITGLSNNQGPDRISHITVSLADEGASVSGHALNEFLGTGGAQNTGILIAGSSAQLGHSHTEYVQTAIEICGNSALNATWEEEYGNIITGGVIMGTGFYSYQSGGVGADIGQSGNGAYCQDIDLQDMDIGNGSNSLSDNINGLTSNDSIISYKLGHGTVPGVTTTATTIPNLISTRYATFYINGSGSTIASGTPVKVSATTNEVTPTTITDTGSYVVVGVVDGESCLAGARCAVVFAGAVSDLVLGTGTCGLGASVIVDTTTNGRVRCTSAPSGDVIGKVTAGQATVGNAVAAKINIEPGQSSAPAYLSFSGYCLSAVTNASATYYLSPFSTTTQNCASATSTSNFHSPVTTVAGLCNIAVSSGANTTQNLVFTFNDVTASTSFTSTITAGGSNHTSTSQAMAISAGDSFNISFTVISGETTATNLRASLFCW